MDEANFKKLFQRIVEQYDLAPDVASDLLRRILSILENTKNAYLQIDQNYEILTEHLKREELL